MELLASGKRLVVDMEEWVNKSSGRGSISLGVDNEDGEKPGSCESGAVSRPRQLRRGGAEAVRVGRARVQETYDESEYDQYKADCCIWTGEAELFAVPFEEWRRGLDHNVSGRTAMAAARSISTGWS